MLAHGPLLAAGHQGQRDPRPEQIAQGVDLCPLLGARLLPGELDVVLGVTGLVAGGVHQQHQSLAQQIGDLERSTPQLAGVPARPEVLEGDLGIEVQAGEVTVHVHRAPRGVVQRRCMTEHAAALEPGAQSPAVLLQRRHVGDDPGGVDQHVAVRGLGSLLRQDGVQRFALDVQHAHHGRVRQVLQAGVSEPTVHIGPQIGRGRHRAIV